MLDFGWPQTIETPHPQYASSRVDHFTQPKVTCNIRYALTTTSNKCGKNKFWLILSCAITTYRKDVSSARATHTLVTTVQQRAAYFDRAKSSRYRICTDNPRETSVVFLNPNLCCFPCSQTETGLRSRNPVTAVGNCPWIGTEALVTVVAHSLRFGHFCPDKS